MERGHLVRFRSSEATNGTRAHFLKTLFLARLPFIASL